MAFDTSGDSTVREEVPAALKRFIWDIQSMVELDEGEREILFIGRDLMARLVVEADWLPSVFASAGDAPFRQYQLYVDGMERFCVYVSVLGAGSHLPICREPVWEICGVLSGEVVRRRFVATPEDGLAESAVPVTLKAGDVVTFSPRSGEATALETAGPQSGAIIVHAYGAEISGLARPSFSTDGSAGTFTTRYANPPDAPAYDILTIQTQIKD